MKAENFCYWLNGFFELQQDKTVGITAEQAACIKRHLNMVFMHEIDPSLGTPEYRQELAREHDAPSPSPSRPPGNGRIMC
jgi:hypothetical protein